MLRDGGRTGTYKSKDITVELECDPADDVSTKPGQAVPETPGAGTAWVERPEGAVFRFDTVRCSKQMADTQVLAGTFPHFFRLLTGTDEGEEGGGRMLFGVHGIVVPLFDPNTKVRVEGDPVRAGTFRYSPSGPNATTDVTRAAFACG